MTRTPAQRPGPKPTGSRADEGRTALMLWLVYVLLCAGLQVVDGVAQTLFLKRIGVGHLPLMFLAKALLDLLAATVYLPLTHRLGHRRTMAAIILLGAAGSGCGWLAVGLALPPAYVALFALSEVLQTLVKIHWGVFLLDHFSLAAGQRTFPLIYSGARIGAVVGGVLLGQVALLGLANLLLVATPIFALGAVLVSLERFRQVEQHGPVAAPRVAAGAVGDFGPTSAIRPGLALVLQSSLLRAIALSTALMVFCRYSLRYHYSEIFAGALGESELARYFGFYLIVAGVISALLLVIVVSRLLARARITGANLGYAMAVPLALIGLIWRPSLPAAVLARLVENEFKAAIKTPISNLFYAPLPVAQRAAARAVVLGFVVPASTVATALLLRWPVAVLHWGLPAALCFLGATVWQNRTYTRLDSPADDG